MSAVYNINNSGPRTEPWGTPCSTGRNGDCSPRRRTDCDLLPHYTIRQDDVVTHWLRPMGNHIVYNMDKAKKIWHKNTKQQRKEKKQKENEV